MTTNIELDFAIATADIARLRRVLEAVCCASSRAKSTAEELLLVDANKVKDRVIERECDEDGEPLDDSESDEEDDESEEDSDSEEDATPSPVATGTSKRVRSRYATCKNCEEEFDATRNGKKDCRWHPGMPLFPFVPPPSR